jgi:hypothetical protein
MASANFQKETYPKLYESECRFWLERLPRLYDTAKARHGGNSLTIYEEVSTLLDYLDGSEDMPDGFDIFQECDNLASRLRRI